MTKLRQKTIYLVILNQGEVNETFIKLIPTWTNQDSYRIQLATSSIKPISNNRNTIVQKFLATNCDFLMMIDDDVVPPPNTLQLADFDKDIITPLMFTRQKGELLPLFLLRKPDGIYDVGDYLNLTGLQECDATGTGCIIIKREVLEKIKYPFRNEYDSDGIKKFGLDLNFCERAKKEGFKVWVHLDYVASHFYTYDLKDLYYQQINYDRVRNDFENLKDYLKEKKKSLFDRAMDEIQKKQLIKLKI
jgi:hypothetical protein